MFKKPKKGALLPPRPDWRRYQSDLKSSAARRRVVRSRLKFAVVCLVVIGGVYGIIGGLGGAACHHQPTGQGKLSSTHGRPPDRSRGIWRKQEVQTLLETSGVSNLTTKTFEISDGDRKLKVETTLDMPLQHFLTDRLDTANSRYIGIVAMEPTTGRVLAMVGFDKENASGNPCVDNRFPAASIFKIVTAAAAIEKHQFTSNTPLTYNGQKHTLYRSQLKEKRNKWTRKTTLKDSFAQSVNPVFGKIGALVLGKSEIEDYARAFGFNHPIAFEIKLPPSRLAVSDDPYQWAEIASGFNRDTRISPLHGAVMAAAVLNRGHLIEPTVIDRIVSENGRSVYRGRARTIRQVINPEATAEMHRLMSETIKSGTCRKSFRGYQKDKILSRLNIGGKTGSINNESHETRYDWFVGFAAEKNGAEKIALSIIVAHEEYIGIRASQYAKMAIRHYFKDYFAEIDGRPTES